MKKLKPVDNRPPSEGHHLERYSDQHVHNVRRRLSLRPPDYNAVMDRDRPSPQESQSKRLPHQPFPPPGGGNGGHPSPPLAGTRGYPYPQDPGSRCTPSSTSSYSPSPHLVHSANVGTLYAPTANHVYREAHFQIDNRPPSDSHLERYGDQHVNNARRRLSLRPPDYNAVIERERYMEAFRYQYEPISVPYSTTMAVRTLKPPVVSVHTPSEMDAGQPLKRPRLAVEPKAPVHQPLLIDTRNVVIKKEPAYTPQVEAISPTLPPEEGRCESPIRLLKENILNNIRQPEKEAIQDSQASKIQKKMHELEPETKPPVPKESGKELTPAETKQRSAALRIYSENRKKALESHQVLDKIGPKVEIPMYNQPSDTSVYHENKRRFLLFKSKLVKFLKVQQREKELREKHLTETYSNLYNYWQEYLKKTEKKENTAAKKAKDTKLREFFEKQFPELKKQREDKERITRVSQRIRSDAEWEEIIDGLQEQELEEKKMRSYAVIPPVLLEERERKVWYINNNGLIEDLSKAYKENKMLHVWTDQEKEIFKEKYLQHPKNFAFIASCLPRKSVADCVQYYYLSKKSENYKQLLRKHSVRKRTRALVKPPPQQSQSSGVTTRQQEDAKALAQAAASTSTSTNQTSENQASTESSTLTTSTATITCSSTTSTTTTSVISNDVSTPEKNEIEQAATTEGKDSEKVALPNNIRKKKEAIQKADAKEGNRSDSDTASEPQNDAIATQPCAICKLELDSVNQSRVITKLNCRMFGMKESDIVGDMRVCASCRFKSVRKRCPIPTCKTPRRKVKRLRPLPGKLAELSKEAKEAIVSELQIPSDVNKCCSACFNRIVRKLENIGSTDAETSDNSKWTDEEIEAVKQGLREHGSNWEAVATMVQTKNKEQCRNFYFNFKRKYSLEDMLQEYQKTHQNEKDDSQQDHKPPPMVTDEEESGETTSSCDEDDRADRCSSDTASAPSPVEKIINEDKVENQRHPEILPEGNVSSITPSEEPRPRTNSLVEASPKCPPDYDSSATMSADEGQNNNDGDGRDSSPRVVHSTSHGLMKLPTLNDHRKPFQSPLLISKDAEVRPSVESSIPLVKTLLQDPKIGAAQPDCSSYIQQSKPGKEEPTCVRDLIYQAIEMSLQWPAKPGRNSSPIPTSVPLALGKDSSEVTIVEPKKMVDGLEPHVPPAAHSVSRHSSRPSSHHMEIPPECEVQDLSKKVKSRDVSPVKDFVKRERVMTPVRPPSGSSGSVHYYGAPPPAHCNQFRSSQPPPPALSPHFVAEPHHESYYARGGDSRGKTYLVPERPHSQPPHLVAQSSSMAPSAVTTHAKPVPVKATVPPPPPLVASKPSQMSPKMPYKERMVSLPPTGSITQGTPVNQQSMPIPPTNLPPTRYEGFLRQLPPPQTKEGGSITLGTPVQHDSVKRLPSGRPETLAQFPDGLVRQAVPALYDPNVIEYYRQVVPPGSQPYSFPPGYAPYPGSMPPQRPPYANESLQSSKQIMIDFNTSKQMQLRRGAAGPPEKEIKVSPRGSDNNPANVLPQENHLHPMYPPANYQAGNAPHYANHVPAGYQPVDSRYIHHRSPNSQIDRTRSPSGVESPLNNSNYGQMPGKHSPNLNMSAGRQNVIHRSITWGTGKPSVIQVPQSASPRTQEMRSEAVSPASIRKATASPRQSQPLMYPSVPPSGHDAFNTLVNAAVAQPSLAVPKDGKGSPSSSHLRQDSKSPRDRPVVEGLEKTLIDMHRPRSYTESSHHDRMRNSEANSSDQREHSNDNRYSSTPNSYDLSREHHRMSEKQLLMNEQPSSLRLSNMREPFSREQFERQMRQTTGVTLPRERSYEKNEDRPRSSASENPSKYSTPSQPSDLDNEASKIFSQSFQKDAPRSNASPRGFTAANLIDAIITRQINQNVDVPSSKSSSVDLFNQYNVPYDGSKTPPKPKNSRTEVVTIDDEPENEKNPTSWNERPSSRGRSSVPPNNSHSSISGVPVGYSGEKVYTLSEHIAAIISKDYNNSSDSVQSQPLFSNSQSSTNTSVSSSRSAYGGNPHNPNSKPLEGIAAALPPDIVMMNSNVHGIPDHSPQNCPGNGCTYHSHSWKLRRALQQDREREHRAMSEAAQKRPSSNQSSDAPQEERQIIRVAQTSSPMSQNSGRVTPAVGPYAVEPISPPSQVTESSDSNGRNTSSQSTPSQLPAWANNPSITGLLTTRYIQQEYPEGIPPPTMAHYPLPSSNASPAGNRPPHQQQMGLSPLDYVKNRIVEVMRTATDDEPESAEPHRPQSAMSSHSDEREHQLQQMYRLQQQQNAEMQAERPGSTGNGPPLLQGQRYSPAVSRYSPVPPRPSSAAERVPSRNSTPGEISRQHKRNYEGHVIAGDWRDGQNVSRGSSRSVSPSIDNLENMSRKKTRSEGTFIPESTTDRAPVLLPQNSISVHRSGSMSEAPRLSSSNQSAPIMDCQSASKGIVSPRSETYLQPSQADNDSYKYRVSDSRPDQWGLVNNHCRTADPEPLGRPHESMNIGAASSTTVESYSPSCRSDIPSSKNSDRGDPGTRHSPVTSSGAGSLELSRNSPSASSQGQRSASSTPIGVSASPSSGHYPPFGASNGNVSSSTNAMFSTAPVLPPHSSPHVAYSSFPGIGTTMAYPFSALSMRSLATSSPLSSTLVTNSSPSVSSSSRASPMPARNSPSPLSRNNQPPPLLSSKYEPLSDED